MLLAILFTIAVVAVVIRGDDVSSGELATADASARHLVSRRSDGRRQAGLSPASLSLSEAESIVLEQPAEAQNGMSLEKEGWGNSRDADGRVRLARGKICEILKVRCLKNYQLFSRA